MRKVRRLDETLTIEMVVTICPYRWMRFWWTLALALVVFDCVLARR